MLPRTDSPLPTRLLAATRIVLRLGRHDDPGTACASTRQGGGTSSVTDGAELVRAMHDRYANQWYRTLTFTQAAITFPADSAPRTEIWHEALSLPGRLRIDNEPMATRNGVVYARDSVFTFSFWSTTGTGTTIAKSSGGPL